MVSKPATQEKFGAEKTKRNVKWYQTILKVAWQFPDITINGNHNDKFTRNALREFQKFFNLKSQSGFLTVDSNVALNQIALQWIYRISIDNKVGKFTQVLKDKIKQFQRDNGLEPDGKVGPQTMDKMVNVLTGQIPTNVRSYHDALGDLDEKNVKNISAELSTQELFEFKKTTPGLIGEENRMPVSNTTLSPWRWICMIQPMFPGAGKGQATGLLISPRHILTSAHVIYGDINDDFGNRCYRFANGSMVSPGYDGRIRKKRPYNTKKPFKSWKAKIKVPLIPECYVSSIQRTECRPFVNDGCDFALIRLVDDIGNKSFIVKKNIKDKGKKIFLGYWGKYKNYEITAITPESLDKQLVHTAGYPVMMGDTLVKTSGKVDNSFLDHYKKYPPWKYTVGLFEKRFSHKLDTTPGQSGSPMWSVTNKKRPKRVKGKKNIKGKEKINCLVGIVSYVSSTTVSFNSIDHLKKFNVGIALTKQVLEQIVTWEPDTFALVNNSLIVKKGQK